MAEKILKGGEYRSFQMLLAPIERIDPEEQRRIAEENGIENRRQAAYDEGQARGYRDGFDNGREFGAAKGHIEGRQAALEEFQAETAGVLKALRESLEKLVNEFETARQEWFVAAEQRYADLTFEVARRALAKELSLSRESVLTISREVLAEVRAGTSVRVRVNPSDVSILEANRADLMATLTNVRGIEVLADTSVDAGVVIESEDGLIDARVNAFLERIVQGNSAEAA